MSNINQIREALSSHITSTPDDVKRFFKTNPGSYGANDQFVGVSVPNLRKISKLYNSTSLDTIAELLSSKINEERLLALLILVINYQKASETEKQMFFQFYLDNIDSVNNWNLVDSSAHLIIGAHIYDKDRTILTELARSHKMWLRRIAIVSTWYFIKKSDITTTFEIAKLLLNDSEDLIHKATGWMLREAGKKDLDSLINFLESNKSKMPRTMLRYSIEKFSSEDRQKFLT